MTTSTLNSVHLDDDRLLGTAALSGIALGVLNLLLQLTLAYPFANLANSSAVWALCAFTLAAAARTTPGRAATAASLQLVVAVIAYYTAAITLGRADVTTLVAPGAISWMAFGVVAGVVFGVAGSWARDPRPWHAATGLAAASAVFFAEALAHLSWSPGLSSLSGLSTFVLTSSLGAAVLLSAVDRPAHLARTIVVLPWMVVAGTCAFAVLTR